MSRSNHGGRNSWKQYVLQCRKSPAWGGVRGTLLGRFKTRTTASIVCGFSAQSSSGQGRHSKQAKLRNPSARADSLIRCHVAQGENCSKQRCRNRRAHLAAPHDCRRNCLCTIVRFTQSQLRPINNWRIKQYTKVFSIWKLQIYKNYNIWIMELIDITK